MEQAGLKRWRRAKQASCKHIVSTSTPPYSRDDREHDDEQMSNPILLGCGLLSSNDTMASENAILTTSSATDYFCQHALRDARASREYCRQGICVVPTTKRFGEIQMKCPPTQSHPDTQSLVTFHSLQQLASTHCLNFPSVAEGPTITGALVGDLY